MRCLGVSYCSTAALYCTIIVHTGSHCTVTHHMWQWTIHNMIKIVTSLSQSRVTSAVGDYQGNDHNMPSTTALTWCPSVLLYICKDRSQLQCKCKFTTNKKYGKKWQLHNSKNTQYVHDTVELLSLFEFSKHCIGDCITSTDEIVVFLII